MNGDYSVNLLKHKNKNHLNDQKNLVIKFMTIKIDFRQLKNKQK